MKIAYFTEMNFIGKIPRDYSNMRVEFAWMCALQADCFPLEYIPNNVYDLTIISIPKLNPEKEINLINRMGEEYLKRIKKFSKKVAIIQEGPHWFYQDYTINDQIWYFNLISQADILFVHNKIDKTYFQGLLSNQDVRIFPTLIIEDLLNQIKIKNNLNREGVIVGGGFNYWYNGFDSYIIAQELNDIVSVVPMRKKENEEYLPNITHLPYLPWIEWMEKLNNFKYAIHLMRTHAAGTFALNCAYLGIPCIGYKGLDTQEICHPDLSVDLGDLQTARKLAKKLRQDEEFYLYCSNITKEKYNKHYHENIFNSTFKKQFEVS